MKKIFIVYLFISISLTGYSQSDTSSLFKKNKLNGHVFLNYARYNSPFISTSLKINVGVGSTSVITIPPMEIDGIVTPAIYGTIMFAEASFYYQQKFTPWLSLNIHSISLGRFGADAFSLLFDGVNTIYGGSIGWKIRMFKSEKLIVSSNIFVENLSGNFINIRQFVNDILDSVPDASISKNIPSLTGGINIKGAYAFNQTFGIQAEIQLNYGETYTRDNKSFTNKTSVLGEADFYPRYQFPLGLGLGYMLSSTPETSMKSGDYISLGIFKLAYTGSPDYDLGLEFMTYKLKLYEEIKDPFVTQVIFSFKFYF